MVVAIRWMAGVTDETRVMRLVAAAERNSTHPVGVALHRYAQQLCGQEAALEPKDLVEDMGAGGVRCVVDGVSVMVGTAVFVGGGEELSNAMESEGKGAVLVALDGKIVCVLGIADAERPDAKAVVAWLQSRGVSTVMVTGDRELAARAVAKKLGIDRVHASMKPHAKQNLVMSLQEKGEIVLFLGDGINDSPALAKADVGIAIGASAPVAVQAADIVLMRNNLSDLCTAVDLSQTVFRRIRLNFLFAFMYNCVGVPLAAGVLYPLIRPMAMPPAVCALAMALSSTTVVFSSLLLKRYVPPRTL